MKEVWVLNKCNEHNLLVQAFSSRPQWPIMDCDMSERTCLCWDTHGLWVLVMAVSLPNKSTYLKTYGKVDDYKILVKFNIVSGTYHQVKFPSSLLSKRTQYVQSLHLRFYIHQTLHSWPFCNHVRKNEYLLGVETDFTMIMCSCFWIYFYYY